MSNTRKHDFLMYQKNRCFTAANTCYLDKKIIICGYIYVNNIQEKQIILDSQTGYGYVINLPNEFINVKEASQCNVSLSFEKVLAMN